MKKVSITGEKIVNLCLLLTSVFYLAYSLSHYKIGTIRMPKEGFMPMLIGVGSVGITAFLTLQAFLNKGDAQHVKFHISWLRFFILIAISVAYAFLMNVLGYLLATFLFLIATFCIARVEGVRKILLISLISSVAFYLIFKVALGVLLPVGFLGL